MRRPGLAPLVALATGLALLVPQTATAATKSVSAGPSEHPHGMPEGGDVNQFFPAKIKVRRGDSVSFAFNGFHDIYFPGRGGTAEPLAVADPDSPISGVDDAAGNPFWFNGQPRLIVNPAIAGPSGDGVVDGGKQADGSGLPAGGDGPPPPWKAKFTKTGSFTYFCSVHPGMKGKVKVKRGKRVPSTRADEARAARQLAKAVKRLKKDAKYAGPGGAAVAAGNDTKGTALLRFFPDELTVKAGTPVKFSMTGRSGEVHNIGVAPEAYVEEQSQALIAPDFSSTPPKLVLNPVIFLPSDPPSAFPSHSTTLHGNGFINTGALDRIGASPQPDQGTITFSEPGTYQFWCFIHAPDMRGTVTVTP